MYSKSGVCVCDVDEDVPSTCTYICTYSHSNLHFTTISGSFPVAPGGWYESAEYVSGSDTATSPPFALPSCACVVWLGKAITPAAKIPAMNLRRMLSQRNDLLTQKFIFCTMLRRRIHLCLNPNFAHHVCLAHVLGRLPDDCIHAFMRIYVHTA